MQAEHLRNCREFAARGLDMSRLIIAAWDIPGRCDIRAMTYVINAHLRRHDTFRSWFEYTDSEHIVRRTIDEPGDIEFVPTEHGEMTPAQWQNLSIWLPRIRSQWDCFRFMIIQHADHFTFCVSVDHLHIDAMFLGVLFAEIHMHVRRSGGRRSAYLAARGWQLSRLLCPAAPVHIRPHLKFPRGTRMGRILRKQ